MASWLGWLLDVRLHLTLFAMLLFAIIMSDGSKTTPERPWRVDRLVQRQEALERSLALAASRVLHEESLRLTSGSAEAP